MTASRPNTNVVLVAEDDPIIRMLLKALLERRGLRVLPAADGVEALELFQLHAEEVSLVITDLNMPRLDGPGLVRRLMEQQRNVGIIITSGLPEMINEVRRVWGEEIVVMPKPYDARDLAQALERAGVAVTA